MPDAIPGGPIENCYRVLPGRLLAGEHPGGANMASTRRRLQAFADAGIVSFLDLTEENEVPPYAQWLEGAVHRRFPIPDMSVPQSPSQMIAILDYIDQGIDDGHFIYVHCRGGIGRTGLVVGCWLARHRSAEMPALDLLLRLWCRCPNSSRHASPETADQRRYISTWPRHM